MIERPWEGDLPSAASAEDILSAFRLLLGRLPSREEWPGHSSLAGQPLADVIRIYLNSAEFKSRKLLEVSIPSGLVERHNGRFIVTADENDPQLGIPALAGQYENHVGHVLESFLKPGGHFLDIGANLGYFSLLAATLVGPSGLVYAIEPNDYNVKLLESSRRANGFENLTVAQVGASDRHEVLFMHAAVGNGSTSSVGQNDSLFSSRTIAGVPLDDLLSSRAKPVDLIKIDVEGFEYKALQGAQKILEQDRPAIAFEFQGSGLVGIDSRGFLQWLADRGYKFVTLIGDRPFSDEQSIDDVMAAYAQAGYDHIDVLAKT